MFEDLKCIPRTEPEVRDNFGAIVEIYEKFNNIIPAGNMEMRWYGNYSLNYLGYIFAMINALTASADNKSIMNYFENDATRFKSRISRKQSGFGIIINQQPSTQFNPTDYPTATYLEQAQDFLKQTSHHFLRIFTIPECDILFVWTNKEINPESLYMLFSLEFSLHQRTNPLMDKVLDIVINHKDVAELKKVLKEYFLSDEVIELEFQKFKKCLTNQHKRQIDDVRRKIDSLRTSITDYESAVARFAADIRKQNEKLAFLMSLDGHDDDQKLFYKHLKKIPYIYEFKGNDSGYITLSYRAPLIYFSEYPAEKLIEQNYRTREAKQIIKAIIGKKYELWTKCAIDFDTESFNVSAAGCSDNCSLLPHPHIDRYNCFGNHRTAIAESAEAGDYIGAVEQITQAVLNLNFYDTCVVDEMCRKLLNHTTSIIAWKNKETGEMLSTAQLFERGDYYEETQSDK